MEQNHLSKVLSDKYRSLIEAGDQVLEGHYKISIISDAPSYFIGLDVERDPCVLIEVRGSDISFSSPIQLDKLSAAFGVKCNVFMETEGSRVGTFTVVKCKSEDSEIIDYFWDVCALLIDRLGQFPTIVETANAVQKVASIFELLRQPASRTVNGLFGELFFIYNAPNVEACLDVWRTETANTFDFSYNTCRLEVKTSSTRERRHTFSYEQCVPPSGICAILCSILIERIPGGITMRQIIKGIEDKITDNHVLRFKLHEIISSTLGSSLMESLEISFDEQRALDSLNYYDLEQIPRIREMLPPGVSEVKFRSDLTNAQPLQLAEIVEKDPSFSYLFS